MTLGLYYYPSYERSYKTLGSEQRQITGRIINALEVYYLSGCDLEKTRNKLKMPSFFYKQLRKPYYEAGIETNIRVLIRREKERCIAMLVGSHNDIKKALARN